MGWKKEIEHKKCGGIAKFEGMDGLGGGPVYKCQKCRETFWLIDQIRETETNKPEEN